MFHRLRALWIFSLLFPFILQPLQGKDLPTVESFTKGMEKLEGFIPLYWDAQKGQMLAEIDFSKHPFDFLYTYGLATGIGSNPIGLDRGREGDARVVYFHKEGPRVLLVERNLRFRASSQNPAEVRSVEEAFASSVLWGGDVLARTDKRVIVDLSKLFLSDQPGISALLSRMKQGQYKVDPGRSSFFLERTKNFPQNTEVEVILTFTGSQPGPELIQTVPTPRHVTVRIHHSFITLPDGGYRPRVWDPRSGFFGIEFMDFGTRVEDRLVKRWIARHRLIPKAGSREPEKPIVYYVDSGVPEPIRQALIDGASWWKEAFERAGFKNAFDVRVLPPDADPMDVRYNVIQWVHRRTRGWSYGQSIVDPRTGEIIKGHVLLGSQRVRQDYMIAEGLLAPYKEENVPPDMLDMALARIRQLSAHEVGHTLGLRHNFAASPRDRASVMDYPHPLIKIRKGSIDLTDAYATGVGAWDIFAIRYGYTYFPDELSEKKGLQAILDEARKQGLIFISDPDARAPSTAHAEAHLWDNGADPIAELVHLMKVREIALNQFSPAVIRFEEPLARLEEVLVPIYMLHRYQIQAVAKLIGGYHFEYSVREKESVESIRPVTGAVQIRALDTLLQVLEPSRLALPETILSRITPGVEESGQNREFFSRKTGRIFDPLAPAEALTNHVMTWLLEPSRVNRVYTQVFHDTDLLDLKTMLNRMIEATLLHEPYRGKEKWIHFRVNHVVLYHFLERAKNPRVLPGAQAVLFDIFRHLEASMIKRSELMRDPDYRTHYRYLSHVIHRFLERPEMIPLPEPSEPPPGQPIGMETDFYLVCPQKMCSFHD